ncbi:MAG TPA: PilZ domain-containing protein [Bryobacteraceae bacterium]|nr:PilZ domain-containing protein [Bryobacteraceae bacterium]
MRDKRSEVRMMCADVVEASWADSEGEVQQAKALLENISPSGACLQFEVPIPTGVRIQISCPRNSFVGTVRYCSYQEIGYFVGLQFEPQSHWSRRSFKPRHLLDLQELAGNGNRPE